VPWLSGCEAVCLLMCAMRRATLRLPWVPDLAPVALLSRLQAGPRRADLRTQQRCCRGAWHVPWPHLPVSAPSDWFSNSTICCSRSISTISGATSSRKVVLAIHAALPVDLHAITELHCTDACESVPQHRFDVIPRVCRVGGSPARSETVKLCKPSAASMLKDTWGTRCGCFHLHQLHHIGNHAMQE
jgi:hypothetical protein